MLEEWLRVSREVGAVALFSEESEGFRCCRCDLLCDQLGAMLEHVSSMHSTAQHHKQASSSGLQSLPSNTAQSFTRGRDQVFKCNQCPYRTARKDSMVDHVVMHSEARSFACDTCGSTYKRRSAILKHIKFCHLNLGHKPFKGKECGRAYSNSSHQTHSMPQQCPHCKYSTKFRSSLSNHIYKVHERARLGNYECHVCSFESTHRYLLDRHLAQLHAVGQLFNCEHCDKEFLHRRTLKQHILQCHPPDHVKYQCEVCEMSFTTPRNFKGHNHRLHRLQPRTCFCGVVLDTTFHWRAHKRQHVTAGDLQYPCGECGQVFHTNKKRRDHMRVHNKRKLNCDHCPKGFKQLINLQQHVRKHHPTEAVAK